MMERRKGKLSGNRLLPARSSRVARVARYVLGLSQALLRVGKNRGWQNYRQVIECFKRNWELPMDGNYENCSRRYKDQFLVKFFEWSVLSF
jgi:hypothetical protein